jgi:acyl-CoA synthetase
MVEARRPVRPVPSSLREHYLAQGWWSEDTLGSLVDRSLAAATEAGV